jgi:hypothetical protein
MPLAELHMVSAQPLSFNADIIKSEYPFYADENIPFVIGPSNLVKFIGQWDFRNTDLTAF